ncbi:MAG: hypothetical protein HRT56_01965 [Coraliomargarita sp.]|nr:hypothetical protein [Coraliomargarita sp.]
MFWQVGCLLLVETLLEATNATSTTRGVARTVTHLGALLCGRLALLT